ncbi:MAG: transglycosylase domain-containing protein [Candidatus Harrisonbacteria bacterium]|nr:transglycosylase domain-containing protein [Candidatus Harrisonbacteria bacterium]
MGIKIRLILISALACLIIGGGYFLILTANLPNAELLGSRQIFESTKIYDKTGEVLLYEIHGEEKRTVIPFEEIPEKIKQATLAIEDENFYNHPAFDLRSILRALIINISRGRISQGGSTITQQLAKKAFLTDDRTITRKLKELVLAIKLEKQFTKDEIFNLYLNQIPYGSNAYGIEAAAKTFFGKNAKDMTLAEAALLAALPKAPSYFSPYGSHIDELLARKDLVLEKMEELGFISENQKTAAQEQKLTFEKNYTGIKAPHFALIVQDYLNDKYGEDFVRTAGLKVTTTLDWKLQESAEKAVLEGAERNKEFYQGHNASLVAEDATTGQILAMVGSRDYFADPEPEGCKPGLDCRFEGNFNVAVQGLRQPGSAIKPFAYATAMKKGFTPDAILFDLPTEFAANNPDCPLIVDFEKEESSEECFHPRNFDEVFRGPVTFRQALGQSINVPAAKVLYLAGIDNLLKLVRDFGITTLTERSRYGLSLVLGGGEIKLKELVHAYSVFAQDGIRHPNSFILRIEDDGKILEEYKDEPTQVIEQQYARLINDILSDIDTRSGLFSSSLSLTVFSGQDVALKTGTTNDYRDAWAIGYTPSLVVGVWAGNNDNTPMQQRGSSILAAVPIWNAFMKEALADRPTEPFNRPDPIFTDKPILKGEYVVNYRVDSQQHPHIHSLLYYVDKNDPQGSQPANPDRDSQFKNWEDPVIEWARKTISNFDVAYNKPVSQNAQYQPKEGGLGITVLSPNNGEFIKNPMTLAADVLSSLKIKRFEIYLNGNLIDQLINLNANYSYRKNYNFSSANLQNTLKFIAVDEANNRIEKEIILYQ